MGTHLVFGVLVSAALQQQLHALKEPVGSGTVQRHHASLRADARDTVSASKLYSRYLRPKRTQQLRGEWAHLVAGIHISAVLQEQPHALELATLSGNPQRPAAILRGPARRAIRSKPRR